MEIMAFLCHIEMTPPASTVQSVTQIISSTMDSWCVSVFRTSYLLKENSGHRSEILSSRIYHGCKYRIRRILCSVAFQMDLHAGIICISYHILITVSTESSRVSTGVILTIMSESNFHVPPFYVDLVLLTLTTVRSTLILRKATVNWLGFLAGLQGLVMTKLQSSLL